MSTDQHQETEDREPDPTLLAILVCPMTKRPLIYDRDASELISVDAGVAFPVRGGIPILVHDDARVLSDAELERYARQRPKTR